MSKAPRKTTKQPPKRAIRKKRKGQDRLGLNAAKMIDKALRDEVEILDGGKKERCSAFYAITRQLVAKAVAANKKAIRVLGRYRDFAASSERGGFNRVEIRFEPPSKANR